MAKKKKSKLKRFLKRAVPLAALAAGATMLGRKRATDDPGNANALAKRLLTSNAAIGAIFFKSFFNFLAIIFCLHF